MGILQEFEQRLEGAVEGFFARAFRSGLQPVELAKGLQRYADRTRTVGPRGVLVANEFKFLVCPRDHARLRGYGDTLAREMADVLQQTARERGWTLGGPIVVRIDVSEEVTYGRFEVTGRINAAASAEPKTVPAPDPGTKSVVDEVADAALPVEQVDEGDLEGGEDAIVGTPSGIVRASLGLQDANGQVWPLSGARVEAGRMATCDITVDNDTVSRRHAAFVDRSGEWWVLDLDSTNGVTVNGSAASEAQLHEGDHVALGDVEFVLVRADD